MGALMEAEWNARSTARMLCASGCVGGEQQCAACRSLDLIMLEDSCLAQGKVRDTYVVGDKVVLVTTDRQSAFDRLLAAIPFKASCLCDTLSVHCISRVTNPMSAPSFWVTSVAKTVTG